jgi:hypothetical protein
VLIGWVWSVNAAGFESCAARFPVATLLAESGAAFGWVALSNPIGQVAEASKAIYPMKTKLLSPWARVVSSIVQKLPF